MINNQYTEEKIAEIEQNILSGIDRDVQEEKELEDIGLHIATNSLNKVYKYKFNVLSIHGIVKRILRMLMLKLINLNLVVDAIAGIIINLILLGQININQRLHFVLIQVKIPIL